jgi:catalase-peroxidase
VGVHALTSGLEGAWTNEPVTWDNGYLDNLFRYDWELTTSPAGAQQWTPKNPRPRAPCPTRTTRAAARPDDADLGPRPEGGPIYGPIAKRFHENPAELADAFSKAWYKLLHRDMGPLSRYLGPWVPEPQLWQDPVPAVDHDLVTDEDVATLKQRILGSDLTISQLVSLAWASAASFRGTDKRGGANGARIRLAPQRDWEVNDGLAGVVAALEQIQQDFNGSGPPTRISLADLIVLSGCAAVEKAARDAGQDVTVPFALDAPTPRRSRPTSSRSPCSNRRPTGSATTCGPGRSCRRRPCCWTARSC